MKVKPKTIQDDLGYSYLGCPKCKEIITFPLIRDSEYSYPNQCEKCEVEFDWSERK